MGTIETTNRKMIMYSIEQHWDLAEIILDRFPNFNKDSTDFKVQIMAHNLLVETFDIINFNAINMPLLVELLEGIEMQTRAEEYAQSEEAKEQFFEILRSRGLLPAEKDLNPQLELPLGD
jgi:hypothetical protein